MSDGDDALDVLAALADDERIAVAAAVILGHDTTDSISEAIGLPKRHVLEALTRLAATDVVRRDDAGRWEFDVELLRQIVRESRPREEPDDVGEVDRETASVLRTFLRGGRLTQIPTQHSKRLVVLDHICRVFDIGVRYPEREVNAYLRAFHPDTAALRRYLVDEGFLTREHNMYWRTGGSVDL